MVRGVVVVVCGWLVVGAGGTGVGSFMMSGIVVVVAGIGCSKCIWLVWVVVVCLGFGGLGFGVLVMVVSVGMVVSGMVVVVVMICCVCFS